MDIRKITETVSVSPQILPSDVAAIHAAGFRSIICNRPDGEAPDQPDFEDIAQAARALGLETLLQPITGIEDAFATAAQFGKAVDTLPGPVFAYCRSGTRCCTLWALSQLGQMPPGEILQKAQSAGYDMAGVLAHAR